MEALLLNKIVGGIVGITFAYILWLKKKDADRIDKLEKEMHEVQLELAKIGSLEEKQHETTKQLMNLVDLVTQLRIDLAQSEMMRSS